MTILQANANMFIHLALSKSQKNAKTKRSDIIGIGNFSRIQLRDGSENRK